jgi:hypothetical protein
MTTLNLDHALNLRYRHQGSGPALLLFNGATLPLEFWDPVADALARDYQIVRFVDNHVEARTHQLTSESNLSDPKTFSVITRGTCKPSDQQPVRH